MGFFRDWRAVAMTFTAIVSVSSAEAAVLDITSVSSRPDRVSGGDTLIRITQSDDAATPVTLQSFSVE